MSEEEKSFHTVTTHWTDKIEKTLKEIGESCTGYKWMNIYAAKKTLRKYNILMYSSIIIGPISGVLSAVAGKYEDYSDRLNIIITIFGFLSGVVSALIKFSKLGDKSTSYKSVAAKYASLEGNIRRQLSLIREDRVNPGEYLEYISKSFDDLFTSAPLLSENIYQEWVSYASKNGLTIPKELGKMIGDNDDENKIQKLCSLDKISINTDRKSEIMETPKFEIIIDKESTTKPLTPSKRENIYQQNTEFNEYSDGKMKYEMARLFGMKK